MEKFIEVVKEMREAQKEYDKVPDRQVLQVKRLLEKRVDDLLKGK